MSVVRELKRKTEPWQSVGSKPQVNDRVEGTTTRLAVRFWFPTFAKEAGAPQSLTPHLKGPSPSYPCQRPRSPSPLSHHSEHGLFQVLQKLAWVLVTVEIVYGFVSSAYDPLLAALPAPAAMNSREHEPQS